MAKVTFDVSGSDPDKAVQDLEPPRPGVYKAKVEEVTPGFSKDKETGKPDKTRPRLEVVYRIIGPKHKGAPLWDYLSFSEASQWKLDQFLQAVGIATKSKRKGTFDTAKVVGKIVKIRVSGEGSGEDYRARVRGCFAATAEDEDTGDEDEDGETEPDEDEGEEDTDDEDEGDEGDEVELDEDDLDQLGAEADSGGKPAEKAAEILAEKAAEHDIDPDEYATWAEVATAIQQAQEGDGDAEDDGYDELSIAELKKELKGRGLPVAGTQAKLIERLRKNDQESEGEDPF